MASMPDKKSYIPIAERLNQDVMHDNFVPKYSALASAQPSRLVLIGVWLIFAPMAVLCGANIPLALSQSPDLLVAIVSVVGSVLFLVLTVAILVSQTRRYLVGREQGVNELED